jgi:hypothetical protein
MGLQRPLAGKSYPSLQVERQSPTGAAVLSAGDNGCVSVQRCSLPQHLHFCVAGLAVIGGAAGAMTRHP